MKLPGRLEFLWISALIIILDQISKQIALDQLPMHRPVSVIPGLDWYLTFNPGAAFSFLADAGGWQRWFFTITTIIISTVILVWISRLQKNETISAISLCLIFGGAIGNLIDRVNYGYVIDFVQVWLGSYPWPAFNIADAAISIGAVVLLLTSFRQEQKDQDGIEK
ncbi:MAG: signal peptidase II [Gammaproteobacteria bacterium]|jgi:signal peptidase II